MRIRVLFLTLVLFSGVTFAQLLDDGTTYQLEKGEASDPLYGNRPALTMSQREYSQLFKSQVVQPALEAGLLTGALALNLQSGEISICEKAPEPSSLSLLVLTGLAFLLRKRQRS